MTATRFDPLDPDYQRDPYAHYARLREQPALWVDRLQSWWVGRYEDVKHVSGRTDLFSNKKFHDIGLGEFNYAPEASSLVGSDPPVHTRLRTLASQGFKPARLRVLDARIREIVKENFDRLLTRNTRSFDFQDDLAELIPVQTIAEMLGADFSRARDFRRWTRDMLGAANRASMSEPELVQIRRSIAEARAYFIELIAERRRKPGNDIISDFIAAQEDDDRLSDGEILSLAILLLNGGDETTAHLLGNTMIALWDNPDQLELVRNDPSRIPDAIDESLRFEAPVQTVFLWTTQDTLIGDTEVPADSPVIGVWGSANRDPAQYAYPDRFDINRPRRGHMAFGHGAHFCLGNMLARQEAIITLETLFERMPNIRRAERGPIDWIPSYWLRGPRTLPVAF
jgi:cytochrome P450